MYKNASRVALFAVPQGSFLVPLMVALTDVFLALSASAADRPASFADQVEKLVASRGQHLDNDGCQ